MTEAGWVQVNCLLAPDRRKKVEFMRGTHGLYRYDAMRWQKYYEPTEADNGPIEGGLWVGERRSGLYQTASEAEEAARAEVIWLSNR